MTSRFREIPSVNETLRHRQVSNLVARYSHDSIVEMVRDELAAARRAVAEGEDPPRIETIARSVANRAASAWRPWPETVINATGVILHTNLGRAPLSDESVEAASVAASAYSDLEFDLQSGKRGSRQAHISRLVCQATGAEAALVVNNNASAVMLGLAAIAAGKEVIVSRGEAVEIGGGFRIPDVLRQSGATLVEVGTTNRTYVSDYLEAIGDRTAAVLVVHASNFHQVGYTVQPELADVVKAVRDAGARAGRPLVVHDLGSGLLTPVGGCLEAEQTVAGSVSAGADLVAFSGDKLLGGPQAGAVVGSTDAVAPLLGHPLLRALRVDKLILAALGATLEAYVRGEATAAVPALTMASRSVAELKTRAAALCRTLSDRGVPAATVDLDGAAGGGSMPGTPIPSAGIAVRVARPEWWSAALRTGEPPVVAVIRQGQLVLDLRTVLPDQDQVLVQALLKVHGR